MLLIKEPLTIKQLSEMAALMFGHLVKAVIDIDRPNQNNPSRTVLDPDIKKQIRTIINDKITT